MTFTADSPLASKVVASPSSEVGPRANGVKDIRAIALHMAEGGGTVSWLTRPDGNSSHYVVEYSGRIVQMVPEYKWAGSMNPRLTRTNDDAPFTYLGELIRYGATALRATLGAGASDPNRYVIAVEIEGFAKDGPNDDQRKALRELVADIRSRRGPLPCIGHRDQQNYKACPGKRIPWSDYGGHAVATTEEITVAQFSGPKIGTITYPEGTLAIDILGGGSKPMGKSTERHVFAKGVWGSSKTPVWYVNWGDGLYAVADSKPGLVFTPVAPAADCTPAIEAARKEAAQAATAAERTRAQGIRDQGSRVLEAI